MAAWCRWLYCSGARTFRNRTRDRVRRNYYTVVAVQVWPISSQTKLELSRLAPIICHRVVVFVVVIILWVFVSSSDTDASSHFYRAAYTVTTNGRNTALATSIKRPVNRTWLILRRSVSLAQIVSLSRQMKREGKGTPWGPWFAMERWSHETDGTCRNSNILNCGRESFINLANDCQTEVTLVVPKYLLFLLLLRILERPHSFQAVSPIGAYICIAVSNL